MLASPAPLLAKKFVKPGAVPAALVIDARAAVLKTRNEVWPPKLRTAAGVVEPWLTMCASAALATLAASLPLKLRNPPRL